MLGCVLKLLFLLLSLWCAGWQCSAMAVFCQAQCSHLDWDEVVALESSGLAAALCGWLQGGCALLFWKHS